MAYCVKIDWKIDKRENTEVHYVKSKTGWPLLLATDTGHWAVHHPEFKKGCDHEGNAADLNAAKQAILECCCEHEIPVLAVVERV
ncbi:hypothetical protein LCGC14_2106540 [marine sediment metagenome]|uniref:Uncharacterized protein n=1 Tax=marine sediment metagenome TaxID=412755 RepID=A0A0F9H4T2_9ZZZZ